MGININNLQNFQPVNSFVGFDSAQLINENINLSKNIEAESIDKFKNAIIFNNIESQCITQNEAFQNSSIDNTNFQTPGLELDTTSPIKSFNLNTFKNNTSENGMNSPFQVNPSLDINNKENTKENLDFNTLQKNIIENENNLFNVNPLQTTTENNNSFKASFNNYQNTNENQTKSSEYFSEKFFIPSLDLNSLEIAPSTFESISNSTHNQPMTLSHFQNITTQSNKIYANELPTVPAVPPKTGLNIVKNSNKIINLSTIPINQFLQENEPPVATVTPLKGSFAVSRKNKIV